MTKISTTQVCALIKRECKIKTTARELNVLAENFGMHKEHRINNLGGAMVYYWSEKDIELLKIEMFAI